MCAKSIKKRWLVENLPFILTLLWKFATCSVLVRLIFGIFKWIQIRVLNKSNFLAETIWFGFLGFVYKQIFCYPRPSTKKVSLETWLRVGKNIIRLLSYVFNRSPNFKVREKFIKETFLTKCLNNQYYLIYFSPALKLRELSKM